MKIKVRLVPVQLKTESGVASSTHLYARPYACELYMKKSKRTVFQNQVGGFSLIELLVVIAIMGIFSAVAYPNYVEHVKSGKRAAARAGLLEAAQFMERFYAANNAYATIASGNLTNPTLPARLQSVPAESPAYTISLGTASSNGFTLTAAPIDTDKCGDLTLTNSGVKGMSGTGVSVKQCWN